MAESNKVDKDKVEDTEFLEYLDNVNEYIFAVNNYAQVMEDIERYGILISNYAQTQINN